MEGNGSGCRQSYGGNCDSISWLWNSSFHCWQWGCSKKCVTLHLPPLPKNSRLRLYAPKPSRVYRYFANITSGVIYPLVFIALSLKQREGRITPYLSSVGFDLLETGKNYLFNGRQKERRASRRKGRAKKRASHGGKFVLLGRWMLKLIQNLEIMVKNSHRTLMGIPQ